MNDINYISDSGLLLGFHYHDQFLKSVYLDNFKATLKIIASGGISYLLVFEEQYLVSVDSFIPGNVISSCFIWKTDDLPNWFKKQNSRRFNSSGYPDSSKYAFYLTSSFGAEIYITFNKFQLLNYALNEVLWKFD